MLVSLIFGVLLLVLVFFFVRYISKNDKGSKEPASALWAAAGFGLLAVIIASEVNGFIPAHWLPEEGSLIQLSYLHMTGAVLLVAAIEEISKFVPLALFLRKKPYFNEMTDGIIYFGIAALVFGVIEDISYAGLYGGGVGLLRVAFGPFLHVGFTVVAGVAFARYVILKRSLMGVIVALLVAVGAHTIYNFGMFSGLWYLVLLAGVLSIVLNIAIFKTFKRMQKIDESMGKSAIGVNKYCRNCGAQNPRQMLYCERCGNLS